MDFRFGTFAELAQVPPFNTADWVKIDYMTAISLVKEVLDIKLNKNEKLKAKEAGLYDDITNILLHEDRIGHHLLPVYSYDWHETLETLASIVIYKDYGLLYELAGEKICPKATNKHVFIYQMNFANASYRIIADSIKVNEPEFLQNELGEDVLAGSASWDVYTLEEVRCRIVMYFELILHSQGYLLNRFQTLESYKLAHDEPYHDKYYLAKYRLPDGRWLIKPLSDDENILLCGEKKYYQLYDFLLDRYNAPAKIVLSSREMWLYADKAEKIEHLKAYLLQKHLPEMIEFCLEEMELTAVELMQMLLKYEGSTQTYL